MTIDERIERLSGPHEALAQTVEFMARTLESNSKRTSESIDRLEERTH